MNSHSSRRRSRSRQDKQHSSKGRITSRRRQDHVANLSVRQPIREQDTSQEISSIARGMNAGNLLQHPQYYVDGKLFRNSTTAEQFFQDENSQNIVTLGDDNKDEDEQSNHGQPLDNFVFNTNALKSDSGMRELPLARNGEQDDEVDATSEPQIQSAALREKRKAGQRADAYVQQI